MASLRLLLDGVVRPVPAYTRIGRDADCELRTHCTQASRLHALLHWSGGDWRLRDLGSLNGTWCAGRRLGAGAEVRVGRGDGIGLGAPAAEWEVVAADPPAAMALPPGGGQPVVALGEVLVLPGALLRLGTDGWLRVTDRQEIPVKDGDLVAGAGGSWRLCLPGAVPDTGRGDAPGRGWSLVLNASKDERRVAAEVRNPGGATDLRTHSHHRILWVLGRERARDVRRGTVPEEAGWVQPEDVRTHLAMVPSTFYVHLFRLRTQLDQAGLGADGPVLERRATGELRIGVDHVLTSAAGRVQGS